jgi:hypothetical protein
VDRAAGTVELLAAEPGGLHAVEWVELRVAETQGAVAPELVADERAAQQALPALGVAEWVAEGLPQPQLAVVATPHLGSCHPGTITAELEGSESSLGQPLPFQLWANTFERLRSTRGHPHTTTEYAVSVQATLALICKQLTGCGGPPTTACSTCALCAANQTSKGNEKAALTVLQACSKLTTVVLMVRAHSRRDSPLICITGCKGKNVLT